MNNVNKGKAKYSFLLATALMLLLLTQFTNGELSNINFFHKSLTADTVPPTGEKLLNVQAKPVSAVKKTDPKIPDTTIDPVIDSFSIKYSKDGLDAPVNYHADDSMVLDVPGKKIYLYGNEAKTHYQDIELTAPGIQYDQATNTVSAYMKRDSAGNVLKYVKFTQGNDFTSYSDSMRFNMITGKGQTKSTYFMQNEMYVHADVSKKVDSNTIYARGTRFTTCNLDTPHFAFVSNKVKFINKKVAFTGPVHPEVEGVPLPIVLPFGIYPLKQGRHSGILAPTFTANEQLGLALEGVGYYKVLNDNWDITTRGTIYSYGGWIANVSPRYLKRYHYSGNFSLNVQHYNFGLKTDPAFQKTRNFQVTWTHSADTKARPGVTFSANVNAGSSKFNQYVPGSPARNFQNRLSSSIAYAKTWSSSNKLQTYNLTVNANHDQNTALQQINLNLPDITFSVNTQYPFRRKEPTTELKWYENIGFALTSNIKSNSSFSDSTNAGPIISQIRNSLQWGANHSIPISLSLPPLGVFQVSPSVSYTEKWYQKKLIRSWNQATKQEEVSYQKGFYTARDMSYNLDFNTRIYGMFQFGKDSKVQAIRHEIRPSIGFSYHPDFNSRSYRTVQVDTTGRKETYSVYQGSLFGAFGNAQTGSVTFGVDNNVQMKVRNRKDTGEAAIKKITVLDGLSLNGAYDLLADSFNLSNLSINARTNLFDKVNITASGSLDPYYYDPVKGRRVNQLIWKHQPLSLGRLAFANISLGSSFRGGDKSKKTNTSSNKILTGQQFDPNTGLPLNEYDQELAYINNNPGEFADFSIPWSVNFTYTLNYSHPAGQRKSVTQDASFNGDLNLTPKWKVGMNGSYNITNKELGLLSMYLSREMHCWQMSINISPVGTYRYFNISISPKSGLLRDLKINRTRAFYDL